MRSIFLGLGGLAAALLIAAPAQAVTNQPSFTCDEFATALADNAKRDDMQWAGPYDGTQPGKVLIIGAGQKFYVPRYKQPSQGLAPKTVWQNLAEHDDAYEEAYWRCFNATNITINVKR
jgi:hypothetical protein